MTDAFASAATATPAVAPSFRAFCERVGITDAKIGMDGPPARRSPILAFQARTFRTSAPSPPSPPLRDQHMVVHGYNALCVCTPCWAYAVRPESNRLMLPASPDRHCPAVGLCSLLVVATTYSSHSAVSPTTSSASPPPESSCRVPDTAWRYRPPSAESRPHSPY
jgi:hypothetical protein